MKKILFFLLAVLSLASCNNPNSNIIKNAVTDIDGNKYDAVKIGSQVWMAENLKTTRYADGTSIPMGSNERSSDTPYRFYPDGKSDNVDTYGYLYNWPAVMHNASSSYENPNRVQGVCPNGWHVPSDTEWKELIDYVSSKSEYRCADCEECIAKALASTESWASSDENCSPGFDNSKNNTTGFTAVPAGIYGGNYYNFGIVADFWCATQYNSNFAYEFGLGCRGTGVFGGSIFKYNGNSVRCVRD